jgi:competence protein ComEA
VVEVPVRSRVNDAVMAAGGARPDADLDAVNLAREVVDGERIYVPLPGEVPPVPADGGRAGGTDAAGAAGGSGGAGGAEPGPVDLNRADAAALDTLPGIGPVLAQRIVAFREKNGPFADVESLVDVPGIGPAILDSVRDLVTVP